jgi:hypothetical protein
MMMRNAVVIQQDEPALEKMEVLIPHEKLIDSIQEWLPLAGILFLHLLLGLVVDWLKSGKPVAIEEILAR